MREDREHNLEINKGVRLCDDRENHCKYILEENIEYTGGVRALLWEFNKKENE